MASVTCRVPLQVGELRLEGLAPLREQLRATLEEHKLRTEVEAAAAGGKKTRLVPTQQPGGFGYGHQTADDPAERAEKEARARLGEELVKTSEAAALAASLHTLREQQPPYP